MELTINGEKREVEKANTLEDVMRRLGFSPDTGGVAVAVNYTVVPKSEWKSAQLRSGDAIEVIHAVQGG